MLLLYLFFCMLLSDMIQLNKGEKLGKGVK